MTTWSKKVRLTHAQVSLIWFFSDLPVFMLNVAFPLIGVSPAFAVKLFKAWITEKDINSVACSLRKVGMDDRLMVSLKVQQNQPLLASTTIHVFL